MKSLPTESYLRTRVTELFPAIQADLERLVRIPGVAFPGFDPAPILESAEAVARLLRQAGLPDVRILEAGGSPAVVGRRPGPPGAPTVLLYAHYDVQPAGDLAGWQSDPFEPVERDGRLYGRGVADDKAGIMAHIAALRAFGDDLPVGVAVFVEGEEETGSASLGELLRRHREELRCDAIVLADSSAWAVGQPALTTSLRGIVNVYVEVSTLLHSVHSGFFGGPIPDALTALCRILATLHDAEGNVAVAGLVEHQTSCLDYAAERLREEAGVLEGVELIGSGSIVGRLWGKPAVSVLGINAPAADRAPNALVNTATAKVSLRIAPGDNADRAYRCLAAHLTGNAPWGVRVKVTEEQSGEPCLVESTGPVFEAARAAIGAAWDGTEPVDIGIGGSIPFVATFQELFPEAAILVTGIEDPDSAAHGPNESLRLGEFARNCLAETLFLRQLAANAAMRTSQG